MTDRHVLIAFLATLASIVTMVAMAIYAVGQGRSLEALGIGGAVTGLIGVLGTFKPRTTTTDSPQPVAVVNPPDAPVPVEPTQDAAELAARLKEGR
jgi:hypothetical protein